MYYYSLACVIYTPEDRPKSYTDLFSEKLPSFDLTLTRYLEDYQHPINKKHRQLKRRTSQPMKHVPPTPIYEVQSHDHNGLEDKVDFRLGSIKITSMTTTKEKEPVTTEYTLGQGVLYFYRDIKKLPENETPDTKLARDKSLNIVNEQQDNIVCILAVPSYLSIDDFVHFLGTFTTRIDDYQFIRDYAPNKYMVVLKFKSRQATFTFYQKYNGRKFNVSDPEVCHIVYLRSCTISSESIPPNSFPYMNTTLRQEKKDMYELPLCPVCLERMEEGITGLINNECRHTHQCDCIGKWGKSVCPICLYSYKPNMNSKSSSSVVISPAKMYHCFECHSSESLWICLICGNIGCGRYQEAHAYDHYRQTNHLFALEIESQHIWDYVTDGYVHRLIQQIDGGFVELPELTGKVIPEDNLKLEQASLEYSYMLTSQLDSQRMYYEEQLETLTQKVNTLRLKVSEHTQKAETTKQENINLIQKKKDLDAYKLTLKKNKEKQEKRINNLKLRYKKTIKESEEEKLFASSISMNNDLLEKGFDRQEESLEKLAEQVQVLMSKLTKNRNK